MTKKQEMKTTNYKSVKEVRKPETDLRHRQPLNANAPLHAIHQTTCEAIQKNISFS